MVQLFQPIIIAFTWGGEVANYMVSPFLWGVEERGGERRDHDSLHHFAFHVVIPDGLPG